MRVPITPPPKSGNIIPAPPARADWLLYACRTAYAAEVIEIIWRTGGCSSVLVDNLPDPPVCPLGPTVRPSDLTEAELRQPALIPLITPGHRYQIEKEARALGFLDFPPLIDPSTIVARTASVGEGSIVNAQAMIGAQSRLGRFVHVNRSASIGHDADIQDYVTLGPACVLAGNVTLETGCFIGAGAIIAPNVRIGANVIVSAGAVVLQSVPPNVTLMGNPARVVRTQSTGYGGVAIPVEVQKIFSI